MPVARGILPAAQYLLVANPAIQLSRGQSAKVQLAMAAASLQLGGRPRRGERSGLLEWVFGSPAASTSSLNTLVNSLKGPGLGLQVQLRSAAEMNGAMVAYAPKPPSGAARVYLSAEVLESGISSSQISLLLLKAAGQHIDSRLNGAVDSSGDEGSGFVARLLGRRLTAIEQALLGRQAAGGVVNIGGTPVAVENQSLPNAPSSNTSNNTEENTGSGVLTGPQLATPQTIELTDTAGQDRFSASPGTLAVSASAGSTLSYGLEASTDLSASGSVSFDGITYDRSRAGSYGILYLNSSTGQYRFQPRSDWQLNALSSSGTDSFTLSVTDGSLSTSTTLLINFTGTQDTQEQYVLIDDGAPVLTADAQALWEQALTNASRILNELLSDPNRDSLFNNVFGRAGTDPNTFQANLQALLATLASTGLQIDVDLRSDTELNGALAAYAAVGHTGKERIYVNGDLLNSGVLDLTLATSALLEEFGSAIDQRLNGGIDSPGDEGQLFAGEVTGVTLTADQRAVIDAEDDSATLTIEGRQVLVEEATVTTPTTTTTPLTGLTRANLGTKGSSTTEAGWLTSNDGDTSAFQFKEINDKLILDFGVTLAAGTSINFSLDNRSNPNTIFLTPVTDINGSSPASTERSSLRTTATSNGYNSYSLILLADAQYLSFSSLDQNETRISFVNATHNLLQGTGTSDFLRGTAAIEVLDTGAGNDILEGDPGTDIMSGGAGYDSFLVAPGDSTVTISGSANAGVISGFDIITDFALANGSAASEALKIAASGTNASIAADTSFATNSASSLTINGQTVKARRIASGIATFDDQTTSGSFSALTLSSYAQVAAVVDYLRRNDIGNAGATLAFTTASFNEGGFNGARTFVYSQHTTDAPGAIGTSFSLVELRNDAGTTSTSLTLTGSTTTNGALFISNDLAPIVSGDLNGFTVTEDVAGNLVFPSTPFTDVDTTTNLTVTLSINDGTIAATSGGSVNVGGTATARTFIGTATALNTFFTTAGNIKYTTVQNNTTTRTLTVSVTDGTGSNSSTTTINITPVNDAPSITSAATASFAENGTGTVYTATGTDPDASTILSYSIGGTDAALFNINSSTGAVTFKNAPNFESPTDSGTNNVYDITVTASDGSLSASQAVSITVTDVNEAPLLNANGIAVQGDFVREIGFDIGNPRSPVAFMQPGQVNLSDVDSSSFSQITVRIRNSWLQNGADEKLLIQDGSSTLASIDLAPVSGNYSGSVNFTLSGVSYTATLADLTISGNPYRSITLTKASGSLGTAEAEALLDALYYTNTASSVQTSARRTFELLVTDDGGAISNASDVVFTLGNGPRIDLDGNGAGYNGDANNRSVSFSEGMTPGVKLTDDGDAPGINLQPLYNSATYSLVGEAIAGLSFQSDGSWSYNTASSGLSLGIGESQTFTINYNWIDSNDSNKFGQHFFTITVSNQSGLLVATSNRPLSGVAGTSISGQLAPSVDRLGVGINLGLFKDSGHEFLVINGVSNHIANGVPVDPGQVGRLNLLSPHSSGLGVMDGTYGTFTLGGVSYRYEFVEITDSLNRLFFTKNTGSGSGGTLSYPEAEALIDAYYYLNTSSAPTTTNRSLNFGVFSEGLGNAPATATIQVVNVDTAPPTFTSGSSASVNENVASGTVVYNAAATDSDFNAPDTADSVTYSIKAGEGDAETFTINATTGAVSINTSPDYETKTSSSFTVVATDAAGNSSEQVVTLAINDLDEIAPNAPIITSISDDVEPITDAVGNGGFTNDTVLLINGSAEAGSTVTVFSGATLLGTTTADGNGNWTLTTATLDNGSTYSFTAKATDAAGNVSSASSAYSVTVDTNAPDVPGLSLGTGISDGASSTEATQAGGVVTVTAPVGTSVAVTFTGSSGSVVRTVAGNGGAAVPVTLSYFNLNTIGAGSVAVSAVAVDEAGNTSDPVTAAFTLTVTTIASASFSNDSGISDSDFITNIASQTISGTVSDPLAAEESVSVSIDGGTTWQVASVSSTSWSLTGVTLTESNILKVKISDADGNPTAIFSQAYSYDTTVPEAPAFTSSALTKDATPLISGTAEDGASITLAIGGATYTTTATDGTWSVDTGSESPSSGSLAIDSNGSNPITVIATDAAGNVSSSASQSLLIDTTAPAAPSFMLASDSGSSGSDGISNDGSITVSGIETDASWEYSTDGGETWAAGSGSTFVLAEGSYVSSAIQVRQSDLAGNTSSVVSNAAAITIDTTAPAAPSVVLASDSGSSGSDGISNDGSITVSGIETDASWEYSTDGGNSWSAGSGESFVLAAGSYAVGTVQVRQIDLAGNTSSVDSNATAITIDSTAPEEPSITTSALSNDVTPLISGTAEEGASITLTIGGATFTTTATSGSWAIDTGSATPTSGNLALNTNGNNTITVFAADAAGNTSSSASQTLLIDTAAPGAAVISSSALSNDATPLISGTAEDGATITLTIGGATFSTTAVGGSWAIDTGSTTPTSGTFSQDTNGDNIITVIATDAAGNTSSSASQTLRIDTTAPAAPSFALTSDSGSSGSDGITNDGTVTVSGIEADATWEYSTDGGGSWSAGSDSSFVLTEGSYVIGSIQVRQSDLAGNSSDAVSNAAAISIDSSIEAPSILSSASTNNPRPLITGSAEDGATLTLTIGGATYSTTVTEGYWLVNTASDTPTSGTLSLNTDGDNPLTVTATDAAGNVSSPTSQTLVITPAPTLSPVLVENWLGSAGYKGGSDYNSLNTLNPTSPELDVVDDSDGVAQVKQSDGDVIRLGFSDSLTSGAIYYIASGHNTGAGVTMAVSSVDSSFANPTDTTTFNFASSTKKVLEKFRYTGTTSQISISGSTGSELRIDFVGANSINTLLIESLSNDSGSSDTDFITNSTSFTVFGTNSEALIGLVNEKLQVRVTDGQNNILRDWSEDGVTQSTDWTYVMTGLSDGSYTVESRIIDSWGTSSGLTSNVASQTIMVDTTGPLITSGETASSIDENSGVGRVVYTTQATDNTAVSFSLKDAADASLFSIHTTTGAVTLLGTPDYETKPSYAFTVVATDAAGNATEQALTLAINNLNDNPVVLSDSNAAPNSVAENAAIGTVVGITAFATDDDAGATITGYSLTDNAGGLFAIDSSTGVVTVAGSVDYETATSHSITVKAVSSDGSEESTTFSITVTNVDDTAPTATVAISDTFLLDGDTTSLVTITFSEAVTAFSNDDVTLVGGNLSTLASSDGGITWTATFTADDNFSGSGSVTLNGPYTDLAGNSGATGASDTVTIDTTNPTATVVISDGALSDGDTTSLVTITFSEAVTAFSNDDLTVVGGSLSTLASSDGGITWTATFTADDNFSGSGSVTLNGPYTDLAGNSGATGASDTVAIDTTNPTATITVSDNALRIGETATVTITFSEAVTGFSLADLSAENGSLSNLSTATVNQDGTVTYTATFTPTANVEDASNVISLATSYTDAAGNTGTAASSGNYDIDTKAPTLTITAPIAGDGFLNDAEDENSLTINGTSTGADGRTLALTVDNITGLTTTVASGGAWSLSLSSEQLKSLSEGRINLTANITDAAGNNATQGTASFIVDRIAAAVPVITASTLSGAKATLVITAEAGTRLNIYAGGTLLSSGANNLVPATGRYSFTTPELADGTYSFTATSLDQAGNESAASTAVALTIAPPALPTVTFTDTGVSGSDNITSNGVFSVGNITSGNSWQYSTNAGATWINGSSSTNSFTLLPGTYAIGALRVRQVDPFGKLGTTYSNPAAITVDVSAPTVAVAAVNNKTSLGLVGDAAETSTLTFTFSEANTITRISDPQELQSALNALVTLTSGTLTPIGVSGNSLTATYTPQIDFVGNATLTVASGRFTDLAGNVNVDGSEANNSVSFTLNTLRASSAPLVSISSSSKRLKIGETATLTFTFTQPPSDFTADDISLSSGSLSALAVTADPKVWTALYTPAETIQSSVSISLAAGRFGVEGNDNAGLNASEASLSLNVDTLAPAAVTSVAFSVDSGSSDSDLITNDPNQTVTGTVSGTLSSTVGFTDVVRVSIDNGSTWRLASLIDTQAGDRTGFSLGNVTLRGPSTILVVVEDEAGNTSSTFSQSYTYDPITFTGELVLSGYGDNGQTGNIDNTIRQASGQDNSFALTLPNKEAGASEVFEISTDGGSTWTSTTAAQSGLTDGSYRYRGTVTDTAGNTATSNVWTVVVDNTAPAVPTVELASAANDGVTNQELTSGSGVLRVTAEAGASLQLNFSSTATGSTAFTKTVVAGGSTQAVVLTTAEANQLKGTAAATGNYTVSLTARAVDKAGNAGLFLSSPVTFNYTPEPSVILGELSVLVPDGGDGSETGPAPSIFRISRTGPTTDAVTATYLLSGNAQEGKDFSYATNSNYAANGFGTAVIQAGETSVDVVLPTIDNSLKDVDRQIRLTLRPASAYTISDQSGYDTSFLTDNDSIAAAPELSVSDISTIEGDSGIKKASFRLSLNQAAAVTTTCSYEFLAGTASLSSDVATPASGTVTFTAGNSVAELAFTIYGDTAVETDETILLRLSNAQGLQFKGSLNTLTATATIINDDFSTQTDPNTGVAITSSGDFSGGTKNDVLTGDSGVNKIQGLDGNDIITGGLAADVLTSGNGVDRFNYNSFLESSLAFGVDGTDASFANGDRISLPTQPTALWNVGTITAGTLADALRIAKADKDLLNTGADVLATGEAVMFTWGLSSRTTRTYLAVEDNNLLDNTTDFLLTTPQIQASIGSLSVQSYFA